MASLSDASQHLLPWIAAPLTLFVVDAGVVSRLRASPPALHADGTAFWGTGWGALEWLEQRIRESEKTILFISHDRELLNNTATRVVTVELGAAGNLVWTHPGGFASYHDARRDRFARLEELRRRWDEEHAKLKALVQMYKQKAAYNDGMASRYQAAQTRLRKFEEAGPPIEQPREQQVRMRLSGGRTGKRAVVCEQLELTGLMRPFDLEAMETQDYDITTFQPVLFAADSMNQVADELTRYFDAARD